MSIHEYQSMGLLNGYGVPTPRHQTVVSAEETLKVAQTFGSDDLVVKAQVLTGGRGKGVFDNGFKGGVHLVASPEEAKRVAQQMLGRRLVTKQSGAIGKPCNQVMIAERLYVRKEYYFAILLDRASCGPMLIGSNQGGMEIEKVAAEDPAAIIRLPVNIMTGLKLDEVKTFVKKIGVAPRCMDEAAAVVAKLYKLFVEKDATLVEINPFVETSAGHMVCMDAKITFDDNAVEFRHPELVALRDISQENIREVRASEAHINYIGLDGTIGCLVNGAGLAMATMDIIKLHGGEPANFLDVGGGATPEQVNEAMSILCSDPKVAAILINIFGGIMRCDTIAEGIIKAFTEFNIQIPLVVRLQGTRVNEARDMIANSGLKIFACDDLEEAAAKSVQLSQIYQLAKDANVKIAITEPDTRSNK